MSAGLDLGARKLLCEVDDLLRLAAELREEGESVRILDWLVKPHSALPWTITEAVQGSQKLEQAA